MQCDVVMDLLRGELHVDILSDSTKLSRNKRDCTCTSIRKYCTIQYPSNGHVNWTEQQKFQPLRLLSRVPPSRAAYHSGGGGPPPPRGLPLRRRRPAPFPMASSFSLDFRAAVLGKQTEKERRWLESSLSSPDSVESRRRSPPPRAPTPVAFPSVVLESALPRSPAASGWSFLAEMPKARPSSRWTVASR